MKILHTADWHLGKKLNEQINLIDVQKDLLNQILEIIEKEKIDVFVLAGDIFQSVQVPDEALKLLNDFLKESVLNFKNTTFMLVNGNHDPAEKLNFGSDLMVENLKIISKWNKNFKPISIQKNQITYDFYLIPFMRVNEYKFYFSENSHIKETKDIYKDILQNMNLNNTNKKILITHTAIDFFGEQKRSDSEEDTYGNVGLVPSDMFRNFDWVLLGHYHKHQIFDDNIFYSGSIYKYSAKEHNESKGVIIYDLEKNNYEFRKFKLKQNVVSVVGTFKDIIQNIHKTFSEEQLENDFFYIELQDPNFLSNVKDQLSRYFKNIVHISYSKIPSLSQSRSLNVDYKEISNLNEIELFKKFLEFISSDNDQNEDQTTSDIIGFNKQAIIDKFMHLWDEFIKSDLYQ